MRELTKNEVKTQLVIQSRLFGRLKKWLTHAMCLTSLFLSAAVFGKQISVIFWTALILMIVSVIACLIIGLALKRGQDNLRKLSVLLDQ